MAKATATKSTESNAPATDMERLTRQQASWLVGRSTTWLRERTYLAPPNADGKTYNAKELVAALRRDFEAASLPDTDAEFVLQLAEEFAYGLYERLPSAADRLEAIHEKFGVAGLAAVAAVLLKTAVGIRDGDYCELSADTSEAIRQRHADAAEDEIRRAEAQRARKEWRTLYRCPTCERYRFGSKWRDGAPPAGYSWEPGFMCPKCEEAAA